MIKIRKGDVIITVSNAAYRDMFKNIGYEIVDEGTEKKVPSENKVKTSSENQNKDISEKKTSNLSNKEEKSFKIEDEAEEDIVKEEKDNLENIFDILSGNKKDVEKKSKNNRQSKGNKEEK